MRLSTVEDIFEDLALAARELLTRDVPPRAIRYQVNKAIKEGPFAEEVRDEKSTTAA